MKDKKLSIDMMKTSLSKQQMKQIMAGSGGTCGTAKDYCDNTGNANCCNHYTCQSGACKAV